MFESLKEEGHCCAWVTADEAYGKDPDFIKALEAHSQAYVVAVPKDYQMRCGELKQNCSCEHQVSTYAPSNNEAVWKRVSCGKGPKGERLYDWFLLKRSEIKTKGGYAWFLLVRGSLRTGTCAYYSAFSPLEKASLETLVEVAGSQVVN